MGKVSLLYRSVSVIFISLSLNLSLITSKFLAFHFHCQRSQTLVFSMDTKVFMGTSKCCSKSVHWLQNMFGINLGWTGLFNDYKFGFQTSKGFILVWIWEQAGIVVSNSASNLAKRCALSYFSQSSCKPGEGIFSGCAASIWRNSISPIVFLPCK